MGQSRTAGTGGKVDKRWDSVGLMVQLIHKRWDSVGLMVQAGKLIKGGIGWDWWYRRES